MHQTEKQIKETLMEKIETELDALIEWKREANRPTLVEIEDRVIELREAISKQAAEILIESEEAAYPAEMACAKCGARGRNKGLQPVRIKSRIGDLEVERTYWHCRECREGFFPPG